MGNFPARNLAILEEEEQVQRERRQHRRRCILRRRYPARRVYRPRVSYLNMTEEQCLRTLRLGRQVVTELCSALRADLETRSSNVTALPVAVIVTAALNFYASGNFQGPSGHLAGISQVSASHCIRKVTEAICSRADRYIRFPPRREEEEGGAAAAEEETRRRFAAAAGFPGARGAVGCSHVAIRTPHLSPQAFYNRRGFYSLKVQVVAASDRTILHVDARCPGAGRDSLALGTSGLERAFRGEAGGRRGEREREEEEVEEEEEAGREGWLLGGRSYPLLPWLLTPVGRPVSAAERRYNRAHSATRAVAGETLAALKRRFRCLDRSGGSALQYAPHKAGSIVLACCALHNLAMERGAQLLEEGEGEEEEEEEEEEGEEGESRRLPRWQGESDEDWEGEGGEDGPEENGFDGPYRSGLRVRQTLIAKYFQ